MYVKSFVNILVCFIIFLFWFMILMIVYMVFGRLGGLIIFNNIVFYIFFRIVVWLGFGSILIFNKIVVKGVYFILFIVKNCLNDLYIGIVWEFIKCVFNS